MLWTSLSGTVPDTLISKTYCWAVLLKQAMSIFQFREEVTILIFWLVAAIIRNPRYFQQTWQISGELYILQLTINPVINDLIYE